MTEDSPEKGWLRRITPSTRKIALGALIVSILSFYRDCNQSADIRDVQQQTNAMNFRPLLSLVAPPTFDSCSIEPRELHYSEDGDNTLLGDIRVAFTAHVENTGTSNASLIVMARGDTLIGKPILRNMLRDPEYRSKHIHFEQLPSFYTLKEFQPSDTATFHWTQPKSETGDSSLYVLHFLLLYENDAGALYDTYYWARYYSSPLRGITYRVVTKDGMGILIDIDEETKKNYLRLKDKNESSFLYPPDEAKAIREFIDKASESASGTE